MPAKNRAIRFIESLYKAPNRTLSLFQLNGMMRTDWSPRAANEARKIPGVVIKGNNPYTLVSWPSWMFPQERPQLVLNKEKGVFEYPKQETRVEPVQTSFI